MLKISNITHMKQPKKYMFLNKILIKRVKVNLLTFNVKFWMKIDRACCSNFHDSVRVNETHSPPHKKDYTCMILWKIHAPPTQNKTKLSSPDSRNKENGIIWLYVNVYEFRVILGLVNKVVWHKARVLLLGYRNMEIVEQKTLGTRRSTGQWKSKVCRHQVYDTCWIKTKTHKQ